MWVISISSQPKSVDLAESYGRCGATSYQEKCENWDSAPMRTRRFGDGIHGVRPVKSQFVNDVVNHTHGINY